MLGRAPVQAHLLRASQPIRDLNVPVRHPRDAYGYPVAVAQHITALARALVAVVLDGPYPILTRDVLELLARYGLRRHDLPLRIPPRDRAERLLRRRWLAERLVVGERSSEAVKHAHADFGVPTGPASGSGRREQSRRADGQQMQDHAKMRGTRWRAGAPLREEWSVLSKFLGTRGG